VHRDGVKPGTSWSSVRHAIATLLSHIIMPHYTCIIHCRTSKNLNLYISLSNRMLTLRSQTLPVRWLQWQCTHGCSGTAVPPRVHATYGRSYFVPHFSQRSWNALPCSSESRSRGIPDSRCRPSVFWLMMCFSTPSETSFCRASCVYVGRSIEYGTLRSFPEEPLAPKYYAKDPQIFTHYYCYY